jgi:hypothetical protein
MSGNEFEETRDLLRKSTTAPTPEGLESRVMLGIGEIMDNRAKARAFLPGLLKFTAIALMTIAVAQSFLPGATVKAIAMDAGRLTEHPGSGILWILQNTYFLIPLLGLYVFSKIYRIKAG